MKLAVTRSGASHAAHKLHFLFHSLYLTAAALEGHLFYSIMAGGTLLFMLGTAVLGDEH
ncbi:hypothetical protein ACLPBM_20440 [Escherichia coli]|uniref:hypothetical protein n=1 Tax=Enterobacterales TaxID=91347 RepID=UPI003892A60E